MCTRHRTKTNNTENEKDEQYGPSQKPGVIPGGREGYAVAERYQKGSKGYRQYNSSVQKMKCRSHIINQLQGAILIRKKLYIKVITKLPNSEQSYKGKVQTHNYINRQNQSTTGKL